MTAVLYVTPDRRAHCEMVAECELPRRIYKGEILRMFKVGEHRFGIAETRVIRVRRIP